MEYLRALEERPAQVPIAREELRTLLLLLAPFAPFITEELWESLGHTNSIHRAAWPSFDEEALRQEFMTIVVQVNGRVRDRLEVSSDASEEEIRQLALESRRVQRFLAGQAVSKVVYVPGRLVNVVVGP
jgi:leucyl-tRNA synthetase